MSAEPAKKAPFVTPFWLDAFLTIGMAHLVFLLYIASGDSPRVLFHHLKSFEHPLDWPILVLTPYAILLILGYRHKEMRRKVLIVGFLVFLLLLVSLNPPWQMMVE